MKNSYFKDGYAKVGTEQIAFAPREIQGSCTMYAPSAFLEDKNMLSRYTYLFSREKSPLSIAIKYSPLAEGVGKDKMVSHYFKGTGGDKHTLGENIVYRERSVGGKKQSIYSLRFSVDVGDGVLFGCFNCTEEDGPAWRDAVLAMLESAEKIS